MTSIRFYFTGKSKSKKAVAAESYPLSVLSLFDRYNLSCSEFHNELHSYDYAWNQLDSSCFHCQLGRLRTPNNLIGDFFYGLGFQVTRYFEVLVYSTHKVAVNDPFITTVELAVSVLTMQSIVGVSDTFTRTLLGDPIQLFKNPSDLRVLS